MKIWKNLVIGYLGGMLYVLLELLWRGRSHPSMFVLGGLCFCLLTGLGRALPGWGLAPKSLLGAGLITLLEFCCGLLVNRSHAVWDYSSLPLNLMGQVCLPYFFLWVPLAATAMVLGGLLRGLLFGEESFMSTHPAFHRQKSP